MNACVRLATMIGVLGLVACGSGSGTGGGGATAAISPSDSVSRESLSVSGSSGGGATSTEDSSVSSSSSGLVLGSAEETDGTSPEHPGDLDSPSAFQSGTLTAGDYDDQLNPALYNSYISAILQDSNNTVDIPYPNLNNRITLKISDDLGNASSAAAIRLLNDDVVLPELTTPASGTVYLYPGLDNLPTTFTMEVRDRFGDVAVTEAVNLEQLPENRTLEISLPAQNQEIEALDLMLVVDTTGSMGDELAYLKVELDSIVSNIGQSHPNLDIKVGLVVYRDVGDSYVVRDFPFVEPSEILSDLSQQEARGGGDYPESMETALASALDQNWREASSKVMLVIADAPPHDFSAAWSAAEQARAEQIHIVPVAASGVDQHAEFLMRAMAAYTHSRYIFITDDSGVGNSHKEPDVDCYVVTRLDSMIRRVISSLVSGERVEPTTEELIRVEGNYNEGICEPVENDTVAERTLETDNDYINHYEVSSYFSVYRFGPTLKMYHFVADNAVLKIRFDNSSDQFSGSATLYLFGEAESMETIDYWINNQHSDALFGDAAEPVESIALGNDAVSIISSDLVGPEDGFNGDTYDHYELDFSLEGSASDGVYQLEGFEDTVSVYVLTSDVDSLNL